MHTNAIMDVDDSVPQNRVLDVDDLLYVALYEIECKFKLKPCACSRGRSRT